MNLLLDTNVFIDYLGRKEPFFPAAQQVVGAGFFGDATLWVADLSTKDAFYALNHFMDSARIQKAMLKAFEVVRPVALSADDTIRAARLQWDDYEDCLVALCAERVRADYLITRDPKGFERSSVPVMSPQDWLAMMHDEKGLAYEAVSFPSLRE